MIDKEIPKSTKQIRNILSPIVGEPFSDLWKPVFQVFEFGEQKPFTNRRGEPSSRADYAFDVYSSVCPWSITCQHEVIIGSFDLRTKRRFYNRKTPPRDKAARARWEAAKEFFELVRRQELVVTSLNARENGAVTISMKCGFKLEMIPTTNDVLEYWCFRNRRTDYSYAIGPSVITEFEPEI